MPDKSWTCVCGHDKPQHALVTGPCVACDCRAFGGTLNLDTMDERIADARARDLWNCIVPASELAQLVAIARAVREAGREHPCAGMPDCDGCRQSYQARKAVDRFGAEMRGNESRR